MSYDVSFFSFVHLVPLGSIFWLFTFLLFIPNSVEYVKGYIIRGLIKLSICLFLHSVMGIIIEQAIYHHPSCRLTTCKRDRYIKHPSGVVVSVRDKISNNGTGIRQGETMIMHIPPGTPEAQFTYLSLKLLPKPTTLAFIHLQNCF